MPPPVQALDQHQLQTIHMELVLVLVHGDVEETTMISRIVANIKS